MKYYLAILLLFQAFTSIEAQSLILLSKTDSSVIPYANVSFFNDGKATGGTYSNQNGKVFFDLNEEVDTIEISHLLYEPLRISVKALPDSVYLGESHNILEEMVVYSSASSKAEYLGFEKKRKKITFTASTGIELVTFIPNNFNEPKEIGAFVFYVKKGDPDTAPGLKIVFYQNDKGFPGTKLPYEKIVELEPGKKGKVKVDFLNSHIILPGEGLFAGMEWMGCVNEERAQREKDDEACSRGILCNSGQREEYARTYGREVFKFNTWENIDERVYFPIVPIFGLEVY